MAGGRAKGNQEIRDRFFFKAWRRYFMIAIASNMSRFG
jgi:hypothetical protein